MDVFEDIRLKPKAHFLIYYLKMIERFGPLIKHLRFESRNGYFNNLNSNNKNKENVCQYLAKRHQFMICLHHNNENILLHNDEISTKMSEIPVE